MAPPDQHAALSLVDVHKTYRTGFIGKRMTALEDLSLELERGEVLGLLGPNGSGKTTILEIILDLVRPDRGEILCFGRKSDREARARIGFLPENPYFPMYLTAEETLHFQGKLKNIPKRERIRRSREYLTQVDLDHAATRRLKTFSKGMVQRLGIAQAMLSEPDILLLDEPMSGLDPRGRKQMRSIISRYRDAGRSILFTSHILSDVEQLCDRAAFLSRGRLNCIVDAGEARESKNSMWEICASGLNDLSPWRDRVHWERTTPSQITFLIKGQRAMTTLLQEIEQAGATLLSVTPQWLNINGKRDNLDQERKHA